jgi:hypothetical protein
MSSRTMIITVTGEMDVALRDAFADVDITSARGVTQLRFSRPDASMLHGVLARIEALGLEVLDVHPVDPEERDGGSPPQR